RFQQRSNRRLLSHRGAGAKLLYGRGHRPAGAGIGAARLADVARPRCKTRRTDTSASRAMATADRKSTRLNSSHRTISYAVFCLNPTSSQLHTLSLHDALPISIPATKQPSSTISPRRRSETSIWPWPSPCWRWYRCCSAGRRCASALQDASHRYQRQQGDGHGRSEEHTSELQSPYDLVCRLLLESHIIPTPHSFPTRRSSDLDSSNEATVVYYLTEAQERNFYMAVAIALLALVSVLLGWQTLRVRAARRVAPIPAPAGRWPRQIGRAHV